MILDAGELPRSGYQLRIGGAALLLQLLFTLGDLLAGGLKLLFGIGKGAVDGGEHLFIEGIDAGLIQLDADLAFQKAAAGNRGNTVHPFQCRDDGGGGEFRKLLPGHAVAIHRQNHNGQQIGIDLHQDGAAGGIGQGAGKLIEGGVHFDHGAVHAGAFLKFHHDDADIFLRNTGDVFKAAGGRKGAFHRFGHALLHLLRAGPDVGGVGDGIGQVHIRQQVGGHIDEGHDAENKHQHHCDEYRHRLFYAEAR